MDCLIFFVGLCVLVGILAKLTLNKVVKQFARLECIILFCGVAGSLGIGLHAIPSPIGET
jgi:predicted benzoate:H+ symporter BenE